MCGEILDLTQKDIGEVFQDSGSLIRDIVGLCGDFLQDNSIINTIVHPVAALGSVVCRLVGDAFEFSKDGGFEHASGF